MTVRQMIDVALKDKAVQLVIRLCPMEGSEAWIAGLTPFIAGEGGYSYNLPQMGSTPQEALENLAKVYGGKKLAVNPLTEDYIQLPE